MVAAAGLRPALYPGPLARDQVLQLIDSAELPGMSPMNTVIADTNFIASTADAPLLIEPQTKAYAPFITDKALRGPGSFMIDVVLKIEDFPSLEGLSEIFEGKGSWSMFKKADEYYLVLNPTLPDGPECIARFGPHFDKVIVYCGKTDLVEIEGKKMVRNPIAYPLDQLLLMYALAHRKGALIHASGVDFRGRGYMFTGRSGTGKSTLSRTFASEGYNVLSDDRIVARSIDGEFKMFGTPWSGEAGIAQNKALPLCGIFFISHGTENVIRKITPTEAVERLMPVTSIPWYDKTAMVAILSFCEEVVSHTPTYEFSFRPEIEAVRFFEDFVSE